MTVDLGWGRLQHETIWTPDSAGTTGNMPMRHACQILNG